MASVARKPQSGFPQKDRNSRPTDRRRKDLQNYDRCDRLRTTDGLTPSPTHAAPTCGRKMPPVEDNFDGISLRCGETRTSPDRGRRPNAPPSEQKPSILDDVDMSEVKVQEDQLLAEAGEFVCKICQVHVVGRTPKLTQCSHLFCGDCLAQWFSRQPSSDNQGCAQARTAPCPVCKTPLEEYKHVSAVSSVLWRMLGSTKIICANNAKVRSDGTCEWTGCYSDYQKHIATCGHCSVAHTPSNGLDPKTTCQTPPPAFAPDTCGLAQAVSANRESSQVLLGAALPPFVCDAPQPSKGTVPMLATKAPAQTLGPMALAQPTLPIGTAVPGPWQYQSCEVQTVSRGTWEQTPPVVTGLDVEGVAPNVGTPTDFASTTARGPPQSWQRQLLGTGPPNQVPVVLPMGSSNAISAHCNGGSRATCAFDPAGPDMVQVHVGDHIQVLQNLASGWAYCQNMSTMSTGWAPSWVVTEEEFPASPDFAQVQSLPGMSRHVEPSEPQQPPWHLPFEQQRPNCGSNVPARCPVMEAAMRAPNEAAQGQKAYEVKEVKVSFSGVGPSQLSLTPGELVEVFDRDASGWTYGRKVLRATCPCMPSIEGWFPDWACGLAAARPPSAAPWGAGWS